MILHFILRGAIMIRETREIAMLYQLKKGEMKPVETIDPEDAGSVVSVLSLEEAPGVLSKYISAGTLTRIFENTSMRYESYEDFDLLCVPFFHFSHQLKNSPYVTIFLQKNNLCFVCEKTGTVSYTHLDVYKRQCSARKANTSLK